MDNLWVTKSATTGNEQAEQPGEAIEQKLAGKFIFYGDREHEQQQRWLNVQYEMGRSGQKLIRFSKVGGAITLWDSLKIGFFQQRKQGAKIYNFHNILVPEDVFAFVRAMDEVLNAVNESKEKIEG